MHPVIFYCLIGGLSATVYFGVFALFFQGFHVHYQLAISFAYIMSVITHFTMNRYFTFAVNGKNLQKHIVKYVVMVMVNYVITMTIVYFIVSELQCSPYFGMVSAIGVTVLSGYMMARYWVFK
ncbi:MAG: hypothetical protein A3C44_07555 [Gammaproteobacteria bacterium RIFCSPHIGHO2_02_FULL_39_13]|nr:MAG: hypothetical protein A3C44_07555 [Gammaproteobacteria bacterium RIFCSPHIGHO2_02_FULL_39_13]OGT48958.1 MAG: hypothetical protein A3E53_01535 [Gammaproteobacteria bacterium RIFCSPHIGHO2_12_FULL_39_24]